MPKKRTKLKEKHNQVLGSLLTDLEEGLACGKMQVEILEKKVSNKTRRKKDAKRMARGEKPIRALVADVGDYVFDMAKNELSKINGTNFEVSKAANQEQVLSALKGNRFDILLLDCLSFVDDEKSTYNLIRAAKRKNRHVPIIVYAPTDSHDCDMLAMEAGAADFITMDEMTPQRLEKAIRYCLCGR